MKDTKRTWEEAPFINKVTFVAFTIAIITVAVIEIS